MSAVLLDQVLAYVRTQFTTAEVAQVLPYAGEFNSAEMDKISYSCPAIFVAVLGWKPLHNSHRLSGNQAREVRLAAFVATKNGKRDARMRLAMGLAEKLAVVLRQWMPDSTGKPVTIGPLEDGAGCENLYGQAIDKAGQALWLVDWTQAVRPVDTAALVDWLRLDIEDTARANPPAAAAVGANTLVVTEKIIFPTLS